MAEAGIASQSEATLSLLRLLTQKPQLLLAHADAYSDLITQEVSQASRIWRSHFFFACLALLLLSVSIVLGGVALMLWIVTPAALFHPAWVFWLVPGVPLVLGLVCMQKVRSLMQRRVFCELRTQLLADLSLLRDASISAQRNAL